MGLTSKRRFQKGDRQSYSCSTESEYKNKIFKARIEKSHKSTLCRLYKNANQSIDHVVSRCSKLTQKEYIRGHHTLGRIVH